MSSDSSSDRERQVAATARGWSSRNVVALGTGLLAVSFSAILIRFCSAPPTQIAFYRVLMAGGVFLGWSLLRHGRIPLSKRDLGIAAAAAVFLAAHFYLWIGSLFLTRINSSMVLLSVQPLFALILQSVFLRTAIVRRNVFSLVLGICGAAILAGGDFLHGGELAGRGDLYSIISAAMAAAYLFIGSFRRAPLIPYLGTVYSLAGVVLLGAALVQGDPLVPGRRIDWLWFALIAIFPTLIGHTMLNRAMKFFPGYVVNLSVLVEPILTGIWAWLVFGELLTRNVVLGGLLIVGAVAVEAIPRPVIPSQ